MHARDHLGRVVAAVVDDRFVQAAEARAGVRADVLEAERLEDVDHEVGAAALVVADHLDLAGADRLARGRHDRRRGLGWRDRRGWRGRTGRLRGTRSRSSRQSRRRPRARPSGEIRGVQWCSASGLSSGPSRTPLAGGSWRILPSWGYESLQTLVVRDRDGEHGLCVGGTVADDRPDGGRRARSRSRRSAGSMFRATRRSAPALPSSGLAGAWRQFQSDASGQFTVFLAPGAYTVVPNADAPIISGHASGEIGHRRGHRHAHRSPADVRHGNPVADQ